MNKKWIKITSLDDLIIAEGKLIQRVIDGSADDNDMALLKHYESRRKALYTSFYNRVKIKGGYNGNTEDI